MEWLRESVKHSNLKRQQASRVQRIQSQLQGILYPFNTETIYDVRLLNLIRKKKPPTATNPLIIAFLSAAAPHEPQSPASQTI